MKAPLLSVRDLCVEYPPVRVVDRVSFDLREGEILGLAGESGSGKSTIARAILRMLPTRARVTGAVQVAGTDLLALDAAALRRHRWKVVSIVLQSAMNALNPVMRVGDQLADTLRAHGAPEARAAELLDLVGIPRDRLRAWPHELSGGQRQRVGIALALALEPRVVLLDEPTTALDVVVQRELLQHLLALQEHLRFAMVFVTHDLALLLELADRVAILYAGRIVESGPSAEVARAPSHPYTRALLAAIPRLAGDRPRSIPGAPPDPSRPRPGCAFSPRCDLAEERCRADVPALLPAGPRRVAACHAAR